jgi:hypothetical protein
MEIITNDTYTVIVYILCKKCELKSAKESKDIIQVKLYSH